MRQAWRGPLAIAGLALAAGALVASEDAYGFMPPGGRTILTDLTGGASADLAAAAGRAASAEDWAGWATDRAPDLAPAQRDTLASYAAANFPLDEPVLARLAAGDATALPADGKDLAIAQCQYCHSLFTGYLMQDRDETSWLGTFKAPFHKEIPMDATERATFAAYSAINMPLSFEDVPPELRF